MAGTSCCTSKAAWKGAAHAAIRLDLMESPIEPWAMGDATRGKLPCAAHWVGILGKGRGCPFLLWHSHGGASGALDPRHCAAADRGRMVCRGGDRRWRQGTCTQRKILDAAA